jgi:hypothetical protein
MLRPVKVRLVRKTPVPSWEGTGELQEVAKGYQSPCDW